MNSTHWSIGSGHSQDKDICGQFQQTNADVEQRQLEDALLNANAELEQYRILYESIPYIYFTVDSAGAVLGVNEFGARRLGYAAQELMAKPIFGILYPEDETRLKAELTAFLQQSVPSATHLKIVNWQFRACCKNGSIVWMKATARAVQKTDTNTVIFLICEDITEHKQAQEALHKERNFISAVIDTVDSLVVVLDKQGQIIRFNRACEQITNYSFEEVKGKHFWDMFLIPEEVEPVKATFKQLRSGQFPNEYQNYWITKKGNRRLIAWSNTAIIDSDGSVEYIIGTGIDITEPKRTEEELRQYRHHLEDMVKERTAELTKANQQLQEEIAERKRAEEEVSSRNQKLLTLHRISEITLTAQSLEAAFQVIVEEISSATNFPIIAIELYDESRQVMVFAGVKGIPLPPNQSVLEVPVDQTLSGTVARTGQSVVKRYTPTESKNCDSNDTLCQLGIGTFVCMPMMVNQGAIGVLSLAHPETVQCDDHFLRWIASLANYIALLTEREQAQEALRKSEERYRQLIETAAEGIWILDAQNNTSFVNSQMTEMLGYTTAEMLGKPLFAFMDEEGVAIALECLERRRQGIKEQHDFKFRRKDGSNLWAIVATNPIIDRAGEYAGALGMLTDITERKQTEEALRASEARLRLALEAAHMGTWDWNILSNIIAYSDQLGPIFGLPPGSYHPTYEAFLNSVYSEDRDYVAKAVGDALEQGTDYEIEFRVLWPDGTLRWVGNKGQVYCDGNSKPTRLVGVAMDITERKQAQEAQRQQTERERLMAEVAQRIRQSLNLKEILNTTVAEVRQFLQTERVFIYRFEPDWSGIVVVENVAPDWMPILGRKIKDHYFGENYVHLYKNGCIQATEDIYTAGLSQCHIDFLEQFQIRANLVVPIVQGEKLWGLLVCNQCSEPRRWQELEIDLIEQLATQVAIAIQQAELYQQLQIANQTLHCLASVDGLTQVANRRYFDKYLEREWARLLRDQTPLSLILCDIDFFKIYNDTYGHQAGDECLRQVASAIQRAVKRPADLVARYGGEEFAVILPNTKAEGAVKVAEAIRLGVRALNITHVNSLVSQCVTITLGVASVADYNDGSTASLIAAADQALYQAKASGRDRVILNNCNRQC